MSKSAGIVGGGIMGRLMAWELSRKGWAVTLFDRHDRDGAGSCSHASAGMLAPSCELESAEGDIATWGFACLETWKRYLAELPGPVYFREAGSLVVAHARDARELLRLKRKVLARAPDPTVLSEVGAADIAALEPSLQGRFRDGLYLAREAYLSNRDVLRALAEALEACGADLRFGEEVEELAPHRVRTGRGEDRFDWVIDTRGLGAAEDLSDLRGIRGELLYVHAPEVKLTHSVRLMHPRYPIYISPRADDVYLVGATAIESHDLRPITVRSVLELLSAAYTLHSGFAEAELIETVVDCRPAFPDNRPRILAGQGMLRINGLYRHGFLISPRMADFACAWLETGQIPDGAEQVISEETSCS